MRFLVTAFVLISTAPLIIAQDVGSTASKPDPQIPQWIWHVQDRQPQQQATFVRKFAAQARITDARLRLATDFCAAELSINGSPVAGLDAYATWLDMDVTDYVRSGQNQMQVKATSVSGPAAITLTLSLKFDKQPDQIISTNSKWTAHRGDRKSAVIPFGYLSQKFWQTSSRTSAFDNYEQWRMASGGGAKPDPAKFAVQPGFTIELVRTAKTDEDSWVSMAFDPQGRLTIAKEKKGLLRFTLKQSGDRRQISRVETINDSLLECRGLLYAHGSLYANANNSKAMYRMTDHDNDGQFDEVKKLRSFPGGVGHGRNDLSLGPDGMIYSIHGDSVNLPAAEIVDHTSPFRDARQGKKTTEGCLIRTDKDGETWELLAAGLRNPFGIDFNADGDIFTYDADAEHDMGAAWYRPTRIDHLVSGADFGWRGLTKQWPPYFSDHADNSLPVINVGKGSPTAVCSGEHTKFPFEYRRAMFVLDWTYGRILACHQMPRGAGWFWRAETFLKGQPLNVTDLAVGPDGSLYVITGGRGTESSLYRIHYTGPVSAPFPLNTPQQLARNTFGEKQRKLRKHIESFHKAKSLDELDDVWPYLANADPTIRHAARIAIEHQPIDAWKQKTLNEQNPRIAIAALLALVRSKQEEHFDAIAQKLNAIVLAKLSSYDALTVIQSYLLCLQKPDAIKATTLATTRVKIDNWARQFSLRHRSPPIGEGRIPPAGAGGSVERELTRLAILLETPRAIEWGTIFLDTAKSQSDRMHYLYLLRNYSSGWNLTYRAGYFDTLVDLERTAIGGAGMPGFLKQIRTEAMATLNEEERKYLGDRLKPGHEIPESNLATNRPLVKKWTSDDIDGILSPTTAKPSPARGRELFKAGSCSRCHRLGFSGGVNGPDLTSVSSRFSRKDILRSIIEPSRVVAAKYRNSQVITTKGKTIVGRVITGGDYRSQTLRIATDALRPSQVVEIPKNEIELHRASPISPMPKALLDTFTKFEILDLLAALQESPVLEH